MNRLIYNNPRFKKRRKELRSDQTEAEKLLWNKLRNRQILGIKFFRQYSIGPYIADFYSSEKRLVIELDGSQHTIEDKNRYDKERTSYLSYQDIKVIRFWNNDIMKNIEGVLERIIVELKRK